MEKHELKEAERKDSACRIIWTVVHISLVFSFIFTAYKALECIQSSLNFEAGLGTISISLVYIGYVFSSACLGAPVVSSMSPKWALTIALFSHTLFILANIWPSWWTLPAASLILGIAAGPYWISQGTYMTTMGVEYTRISGKSLTQVAERFSSIFHVIWGASGPLGNLIAAVVLGFGSSGVDPCELNVNSSSFMTDNENIYGASYLITDDGFNKNVNATEIVSNTNCAPQVPKNIELCGASHCPYNEEHMDVLERPSDQLVYIMMAIFLVFNLSGIALSVFLTPISASESQSVSSNLTNAVKLLKNGDMLLLILPIFYIGVIPGIFYASFTQSFVSCAYSVSMVGYAMVAEGIGFTVASLICGPLASVIPRVFHLVLSFTVFLGMGLSWLIWQPLPGQEWLVLSISAVFGAMHGVHRTHIAGLISSLFPSQPSAAFAHYNTWLGLSYSASFAYSSLLCFSVKDYVFIAFTILAAFSQISLEIRIWRREKIVKQVKERDEKDRKDMGELMSGSFNSRLGGTELTYKV